MQLPEDDGFSELPNACSPALLMPNESRVCAGLTYRQPPILERALVKTDA
jgi:hypothetical protein